MIKYDQRHIKRGLHGQPMEFLTLSIMTLNYNL